MEDIEIRKNEVGIFIKVNKKINMETLINFIIENDVEAPNENMIRHALKNIGEEVKIAEYYGEIKNTCKFDINVSEDKMKVYLYIEYASGRILPTVKEIKADLQEKGIKKGFDEENIKKILENYKFNTKMLIAEGKKPVKGKNAEIKYNIGKTKLKTKIDITGQVDYKNLDFIENVKKGDILAEKIEAQEGESGYNVYGEILNAEKGSDVALYGGKNTILNVDGKQLIAETDGTPVFNGKKLEVRKVINLEEVGPKTGNIQFNGTVIVSGDIKAGYVVKATNDIKVSGNVENAILEAGNNIIIRGNCYGKNSEGRLVAKESIQINFAENIEINAEKKLIVNEGLINCNVCAYEGISAIMRSGKIIGGAIRAEGDIEVLTLGSSVGVKTKVSITGKLEELEKLDERLKFINWEIKINEKNISVLEFLKRNKPSLYTEKKEKLFLEMVRDKMNLLQDKKVTEVRYELLQNQLEKKDFPTITVKNKCYPGVIINLKAKSFQVKNIMENVVFFYKDNEVQYTVRDISKG